jgi:hypothetical protein
LKGQKALLMWQWQLKNGLKPLPLKLEQNPYREALKTELVRAITKVSPSFPLARNPQTNTIAVQGATIRRRETAFAFLKYLLAQSHPF